MEQVFDVAVIGLGYIGLPTAATFANSGVTVAGVDVNILTVDAVNRGEVPFVEPDLNAVVSETVRMGMLRAFSDVPCAQSYIVAVPTPITAAKSADMSYLWNAADSIAPKLRGGELMIIESTSPPGTTELFGERILKSRDDLSLYPEPGKKQIHLAHSPERVLPGRIMVEIVENDRVVGGLTAIAGEMAKTLYSQICKGKIFVADSKTAELTKLAENSFRDLNIAYANELSLICEKLGVDVWELIELANQHPRVNILSPGPGVGGHCIAVDPWFLVDAFPSITQLTREARELNNMMPTIVVRRILAAVADVAKPNVALLGLAFKANIDDTRESPAVEVAKLLARERPDMMIMAVEPHITQLPTVLSSFQNVQLTDLARSVESADLIVMLVDHDDFMVLGSDQLSKCRVLDTRGAWRSKNYEHIAETGGFDNVH